MEEPRQGYAEQAPDPQQPDPGPDGDGEPVDPYAAESAKEQLSTFADDPD